MIKTTLKTELAQTAEKLFQKSLTFDLTRDERFADYSCNLALQVGGSPRENAEKIKAELLQSKDFNKMVSKVEIAGPGFLNLWLTPEAFQKEFKEIYKKKESFGKGKGNKKKVVIDYSSPNIAKPIGVGNLRSTIIGQALYNIFKFSGWKAVGDNHLGDWGKQFGILISAYKKACPVWNSLGKNEDNLRTSDLVSLYVSYNVEMKENKELEEQAKLETKKLQMGDKENIKIWKKIYDISLFELKNVYKVLGVSFDYYLGESFYNKMLPEIVAEAKEKGLAKESEGATVIDVSENQPPFIIQKSDEAYLYATTDLACVKYRVQKFKPEAMLYVVGNEQALHLEQLFVVSKMMGLIENEEMAHVKFGLILGEDMKKFSTRAGKTISLEEVLNESKEMAKKFILEKQADLKKGEIEEIAEAVGIGAVMYNDLSQNRQSDIVFSWDKMLSMEGNSAPYLQYTYARLRSILRKQKSGSFNEKNLIEEQEKKLVLIIEEFPEVLRQITETYYPHYLADYLYRLAKEVNSYYQAVPILKAEEGVMLARLALIDLVSQNLKIGLGLLGIKTLERM